MTKPSDFIMNTDYLTLAQSGKYGFTATFPSETFAPGNSYTRTRDFSVPSIKGALDRVLISQNGGNYVIGSYYLIPYDDNVLKSVSITVFRANSSTVRVRLFVHVGGGENFVMPAQTIKVKISCFQPPNVF